MNKFESPMGDNTGGPKKPEESIEERLEKEKKKINEMLEWIDRISDRIDPDQLADLRVIAKFALENLKIGRLSEREIEDDAGSVVANDSIESFRKLHQWLSSKDAQEDSPFFRRKIDEWFDNAPLEDLISRIANKMTLDEQKEYGIVRE
jgi:hypothetical protein